MDSIKDIKSEMDKARDTMNSAGDIANDSFLKINEKYLEWDKVSYAPQSSEEVNFWLEFYDSFHKYSQDRQRYLHYYTKWSEANADWNFAMKENNDE